MSRSRDDKRTKRPRDSKEAKSADFSGNINGGDGSNGFASEVIAPGTTGRYLVLLREGTAKDGINTLNNIAGLRVASSTDFDGGVVASETLGGADAIFFDNLSVAVVDTLPEQIQTLGVSAAEGNAILAIEPERVVYALPAAAPARIPATRETFVDADYSPAPPIADLAAATATGATLEFLRGYRDAVDHLVGRMLSAGGVTEATAEEGMARAINESELTWGLQVTKVAASRFSGSGVRLAVLDTGLDLGHPDIAGRRIVPVSFVENQAAQDGHGHGTHCIGTACGSKQPGRLPRYGIAHNAEIYAGKVLSNQGSGTDMGIIAGIAWAIANGCTVVSMSLGAAVLPGQSFSQFYEEVAKRSLAAGTLIIAAVGNESERPAVISPVAHPANCPSIMAVGALTAQLQVAPFSCGGINPQGGQVDIAGPGVSVRSAWPRPTLYHTISGTSMATPHVAGIAALLAEANPGSRGRALGSLLLQSARRLALPARDVGAGLVQAP
ncbi:MAG: S8 family serine peptidase [Pyrinomonadaceae bacterium]|nr:S8 family serine peptidase [Pyrinomonadaceae bacterium]